MESVYECEITEGDRFQSGILPTKNGVKGRYLKRIQEGFKLLYAFFEFVTGEHFVTTIP